MILFENIKNQSIAQKRERTAIDPRTYKHLMTKMARPRE